MNHSMSNLSPGLPAGPDPATPCESVAAEDPYRLVLPAAGACGVLNLHKPADWTSRDVVNFVERRAKKLKVGHAGTLDPLATGVLVVAVGALTRLVPYLQQQSKTYRAEFLLGRESNTDDVEGEVVELSNPPEPTREAIEELLPRFTGEIEQVPPLYSAVHINGQRAYQLARRGEEFELPARKVVIHRLEVLEYAYPLLRLEMVCGSGTYVRSVGRDLAKLLGTAAVMKSLERSAIGGFRVEEATPVQELTKENWSSFLLPAREAVSHLPALVLSAEPLWRLARGQLVSLAAHPEIAGQMESHASPVEFGLFDAERNLYGIGRRDDSGEALRGSLMLAKLPGVLG